MAGADLLAGFCVRCARTGWDVEDDQACSCIAGAHLAGEPAWSELTPRQRFVWCGLRDLEAAYGPARAAGAA